MPHPERNANEKPVKGALELFRLWNAAPLRRIGIPVTRLPPGGLADLNDRLRHRCWREFCARRVRSPDCSVSSCAEIDREPRCPQPRDCAAHALFPTDGIEQTSGERFNRGAFLPTVHCRWLPRRNELVVWLFGSPALAAEPLVLRVIADWLGRSSPMPTRADGTLDSLLPVASGEYRIDLVTPWILSAGKLANAASNDLGATFANSLRDGLIARARKLTNTCIAQLPDVGSAPLGIRMLLGFSAEYVVRDLCASDGGWRITDHGLSPCDWKRSSERQTQAFAEAGVQGWVHVKAGAAAAPLLALVAVFGAGDSADKGYGSIELTPLDDVAASIRSLPEAGR